MVKQDKHQTKTDTARWIEMARRQKDEADRLRNKNPSLAKDRMLEAIGSAHVAAKMTAERIYNDTGDLQTALRKAAEVLERFARELGEG